ncbi:GNAT acetyltransferase 2-domain-containing protein [Dipodascopsis tothii]|uniref:GNAT acetyltransferase 2-domain-containing protein n=1 Tax=Dipodascopsis tothii TaxID=44089 RepID=UPI0034CEF260
MVKKAIDSRIPTLIRNGVQERKRSFFVIIGDHARDQLPNLHYILSSADLKMNKSVLWAYKKDLMGFTSHRKKREQKIKRDVKRGVREANSEDPFELFVSLQNIRYVYYKETEKILGNTYGMCILQDFEAITPNILARTIETVEGGGLVILMLRTMSSLKQLYTMTMDIHSRYRTEAHDDLVARFNERFILSLGSCESCLVVDDELNVLPISGAKNVKALPPPAEADDEEDEAALSATERELRALKRSTAELQPAGSLVALAKTVDQGKAVLSFTEAIAEKTLRSTVALTAGRGRGKSAAMGLAIAAAVAHGYSNIFVTSPSPTNLKTLFEFVFKGFDALSYEEHLDYDILQSTDPELDKAVTRVNIFKNHRQSIQYIQPGDAHVLGQAELVIIDEAAAIPLPLVRKLIGPYLVFMASTINGYEGTGRALSLKLIQQLREQSRLAKKGGDEVVADRTGKPARDGHVSNSSGMGLRTLREITLSEPVRYAPGDTVEKWLNKLLCLDATVSAAGAKAKFPHPNECTLYHVNRDTLFSFHPVSEAFLHRMMALYVASHYKNSPNDLQLLSDAPAHQLFVLLPPVEESAGKLPEPLCVVQVALEGEISKQSIINNLNRGQRAGGDLIPWIVSQQFQDNEFGTLSGARVVRIATHPDYAKMGYGSKALELLSDYYEGKFTDMREAAPEPAVARVTDDDIESSLQTEVIKVRDARSMPPLLLKLAEQPPPASRLHYMGVSFGITQQLHKFWKRAGFHPVYLRQTANELTGEHTVVMVKSLRSVAGAADWLDLFTADFHRRFLALLAYDFRKFTSIMGLSVLESNADGRAGGLTRAQLDDLFSPYDLKRLESYANNLLDYHVIVDLLPAIAQLYFTHRLRHTAVAGGARADDDVKLSAVQATILLGIGLQKKEVADLEKELKLPSSQVLAMFAKIIRKVSTFFTAVLERAIADEDGGEKKSSTAVSGGDEDFAPDADDDVIDNDDYAGFAPVGQSLAEDLQEGGDEVLNAMKEKQRELINALDLQKFAIATDPTEWDISEKQAKKMAKTGDGVVPVKSTKKRKSESAEEIYQQEMKAAEGGKKKHGKKGAEGKRRRQ